MNVDIYADEYTVKKQAKQAAEEQVNPLSSYIDPSDVQEGATTWEEIDEDTLHDAMVRGLDIMVEENQIDGIWELAIVLWRESLPRVPMRDLVFDTHEEAVHAGYWPEDMCRIAVTDVLLDYAGEYEYFHEHMDYAEDIVADVMFEAHDPRTER